MSFGTHTEIEFKAALQTYVQGCKQITEEHRRKNYPNVSPDEWRLDWGKVRVRVVQQNSAHSFVDMATGDVLKCAGWKSPAKHARGNIYDEKNGLGSMEPYGPAYLR